MLASGGGFAGSADPKAGTLGIPNAAERGNPCQDSLGLAGAGPRALWPLSHPQLCAVPRAWANLGEAWAQGWETDGQRGFGNDELKFRNLDPPGHPGRFTLLGSS